MRSKKGRSRKSNADRILNRVLRELKVRNRPPATIYSVIDEIVAALSLENKKRLLAVGTTGAISERLCEFGLQAAVPKGFQRLTREWRWIGDFYIEGAPFNTIISVKSFKAKERLLVSGTGNLLSPTIGWGLFNDPNEWDHSRVLSYVFRAFFAIYMPKSLLHRLDPRSLGIKNPNGKSLLRPLNDFVGDISSALTLRLLDPRKL